MKKLNTIIAVISLAILTACGTTKTNTTTAEKNSNRGRSNTEVSATTNRTTGTQQSTRINRSTRGIAKSNSAAYEARNTKMYNDLSMNDTQIDNFENSWKLADAVWKKSNRNQTMNNFERTEQQDKILKDILDDTQFKKYQAWARENAMPEEE